MIEVAEIVAGWPLAATMAAVVATQGLRAGRRRGALNEALHELRRPLQAIALAGTGNGGSLPLLESSVRLAAAALERLDHEVNGGVLQRPAEAVEVRPLLEAAVRRWQARASLGGGSLSLRWRAGHAVVIGDRVELPADVIARLSGRRRRGHGLVVVRQVAAAHKGRFALRRSERGSLALLELPLASDRGLLAA